MNKYILKKSTRKDKKYMVLIDNKKVHFGQKGFTDFTINKNPEKKKLYISRHKKRENWNKSGIETAGFWAKHILWNKPTLRESISDTEKNFNINIIKK
jgi:hypothetical protein